MGIFFEVLLFLMKFCLWYKNKFDVFKGNEPGPNSNEIKTNKQKTKTRDNSFFLQLTILLAFNCILLSGNREAFRETETMIGISKGI